MKNIIVNLTPKEATEIVKKYLTNVSMGTKLVGDYYNTSPDGHEVIMLVFEKYSARNANRASLSVIAENLCGKTSVYSVGSGGGKGVMFSFDLGFAESFSNIVKDALENYLEV